MKARGKKRMWTVENNRAPKEIDCDLPAPIVDALMQGYDIRIVREVKEGLVMAKIIYYKYTGASRKVIGREEELKKRK